MNKGFTLIELIIVICIVLLLGAIVWPIGANFFSQELASKAQQQIIWVLKQARANAVNQKNNSAFGVYLEKGQATLFQGNTYADRVISEDINYTLPKIVSINNLNEIVFEPNTGLVTNPGTIKIASPALSREIAVNKLGVIDY